MDAYEQALAVEYARFQEVWGEDPRLTPRQAFGIAAGLDWFVDAELNRWLEHPEEEPLHEVRPFNKVDLRAMILVGENRAWAALAGERCRAVADGLRDGYLSFFDPGDHPCYFDQLVVALAVPWAQNQVNDMPELFEAIPERLEAPDSGDGWQLDDAPGWARLMKVFDACAAREDWNDMLYPGLTPMRRLLKKKNHPFTWFDVK